MLQLVNKTPFIGAIAPLADRDGVETMYAVVKGTFAIGDTITLADEQLPVVLADTYHGEPGKSSIRAPSDLCLGKPATDVLLIGSAWAPGGRPTWQMDVSMTVGPASKTVRVFGDRVWDAGPAGASVVWVAPFTRMPLVWERAFGGTDETRTGPRAHPRNPVGRGFITSESTRPVHGLSLPNLEDPGALISAPKTAPAPACFAPIAPSWQPRAVYAGTYDADWQARRAPYLPADFDLRFFQLAPPELVVPGCLRGGELVDIRGATETGLLQFVLPTLDVQVTFHLDSGSHRRAVVLDTLIVDSDAGRLVMVWRAAFPCDKAALKVREVEMGLPRAA